jgi:lauroyl/myristoyl acyltransferase
MYGSSLREADGRVHSQVEYLPKPFEEYKSDEEVIQALMDLSEKYIRRYPEQYLWFYHRFQYIAPEVSEEVRCRYPYYATVPSASFFDRRARFNR